MFIKNLRYLPTYFGEQGGVFIAIERDVENRCNRYVNLQNGRDGRLKIDLARGQRFSSPAGDGDQFTVEIIGRSGQFCFGMFGMPLKHGRLGQLLINWPKYEDRVTMFHTSSRDYGTPC